MTAPKLPPPEPNESPRDYYWRHSGEHSTPEINHALRYWRLVREIDDANTVDDLRRVLRSMLEFLA